MQIHFFSDLLVAVVSLDLKVPIMSEKRAQKFHSDDWLKQISHVAPPIRSSTQIWVVTRHQYGISPIVS